MDFHLSSNTVASGLRFLRIGFSRVVVEFTTDVVTCYCSLWIGSTVHRTQVCIFGPSCAKVC